MSQKIMVLLKKYREALSYLIVGVLTTLVGWGIFFPLNAFLETRGVALAGTISNTVSWVGAVSFAFPVNKVFVFQSRSWKTKTLLPELIAFVSSRLLSLGVEDGLMLLVDLLQGSGAFWKIPISVLVVVMNYITSKLVFRKKA